MNLLPSMLIATTLISGGQVAQADCSIDFSALQSQLKDNCVESQVIIGNASDLESILGDLGIDSGILGDCFQPSKPEVETPDTENETPEVEIPAPDNKPESAPEQEVIPPTDNTPDTNLPEDGTNNQPENDTIITPPVIETPDTQPDNGTTDTQPDESAKSYVEQVVDLVNAERAKVNLPALTMSQEVNQAAQIRAVETTQSFSHTRPNGSSFSSVLTENGISYRRAGENIAWGQKTPEAVVNAWMNSEGHRANILNANFTTIGVGYYLNGSTPYWVQLFTA